MISICDFKCGKSEYFISSIVVKAISSNRITLIDYITAVDEKAKFQLSTFLKKYIKLFGGEISFE